MTPPDPIVRPHVPLDSLPALSKLFRTAAEVAAQETRTLPQRPIASEMGHPAPLAEALASLVRKAMQSYERLEQRARRALDHEHALPLHRRAMLERGGLAEALRDLGELSALQHCSRFLHLASAKLTPPEVDQLPLRSKRNGAAITLLEPSWALTVNGTAVVWNPPTYLPKVYLHLKYRYDYEWPSDTPVRIVLFWVGPERVAVECPESPAWSASYETRDDGQVVVKLTNDQPMTPIDGRVNLTLTLKVWDPASGDSAREKYEISFATEPPPDEDDIEPTTIDDPVPPSTPGVLNPDAEASGSSTPDTPECLELGRDLVANVLEVTRAYRELETVALTPIDEDLSLIADVLTKLA